MTESFVLGFIFIFHTKKTGKIPKHQSVTALIAACAYATFAMTVGPRHEPFPSSYWLQMKEIGEHWKSRKKKYMVLKIITAVIVV
jgi:hypothetical protein